MTKDEKELEKLAVEIMEEAIEAIKNGKSIAVFIMTVDETNHSHCVLAPNEPFEASKAMAVGVANSSKTLTGAVNARHRQRQELQKYN